MGNRRRRFFSQLTPQNPTIERKYISYLCVAAAIAIKIMLYLHFFQMEGDKLFQAIAAKSLVEGHGFTFQHVAASDLTTQITEHVNRWPIGYSMLLAPFYWLTRNLETACVIVDLLSITFFFVVLYKLLHQLQLQHVVINAIILFTGATFGPSLSKPTDLLACAGLLYTCVLFLKFVSGNTKPGYGIAIGAAGMLPAIFRYMYLPCVFVVPLLLFWTGYQKKDKRIKFASAYAVLAACVLFVGWIMLQKAIVGNLTYVIAADKGFFRGNLLSMYPFIPDAFADVNFIGQQIASFTNISFISLFSLLRYINIALLLMLVFTWISLVRIMHPFTMLTGALSGSIFLLLAYLSITNSSAAVTFHSAFPWTFIGDGRYFLFPVTILPIIAAYWLFQHQRVKYQRTLRYLFFMLIFLQLFHTSYFLTRRFDPLGLTGDNALITRKGESYLRGQIREYQQRGYNVVFTGTDETVSNWATLNGANGVLRLEELLTSEVRPKKPSIVFVAVARNMLPVIGRTLSENEFTIEKEIRPMAVLVKKYEVP